ncbi:MAG: ABC transporter substrate-binding protein [Hyphomicrobiales bacterium]
MLRGLISVAAGLVAACHLAMSPAEAAPAFSRIVSLNACADQFLIALGLADRIAALGPLATDPVFSYYAKEAAALPVTDGSAESVLVLKPDLVLAGPFSGTLAKNVLRREGIHIEEVAIPQTIAEARQQILDVADLLGVAERGRVLAAEFDAALAKVPAAGTRPSALYLQRRLFVTGTGTLVDELLDRAGFANALEAAGLSGITRVDLERLAGIPADVLVLNGPATDAGDQGAAVLQHPLIERLFPAERRVMLPLATFVCGGPPLIEAIATLSAARQRLEAR